MELNFGYSDLTNCPKIYHPLAAARLEQPVKPRLRNILAAALLCLSAAALPARADHLKLGNEGVYPPFSMVDSTGKLVGVEPDLAREMCKRMDADCEFVVMDFKALIPSLIQGKFNALVSQTVPLPERKEKALFSIPVLFNPDTFVVPKDSNYALTKEGLKGLRIGMVRGGAQTKWLLDHFGDAVDVTYYNNVDEIRLDLLAKRLDMTMGPKINWTLTLIDKPEGKDWKLAGGDMWTGDPSVPPAERGRSWLVKKGDDALLARMNTALSSMMADCTFTRIRKQYIDFALQDADAACDKQ
jgi:ABC-type amino acid transport substrate-binding protein